VDKIKDYLIANALSFYELEVEVKNYISQGWMPLGGPSLVVLGIDSNSGSPIVQYIQGLILPDTEEERRAMKRTVRS
jgi:hypothetical protein